MDLEDSFIEKLVERKKARKGTIIEKKQDVIPVGKKRAALVEEHQVDSGNPLEESPKRHCTGAMQSTCPVYDKENVEMLDESADAEFVPYHSASKTRGLAALKKRFMDDDDDTGTATEQQETPTSVKSPVKTDSGAAPESAPGASNKKTVNLQCSPDFESEECSDDDEECIDEFAENYNDIKCDGSNKMDFDCTPVKPTKVQEKVVKPIKSETIKKPLSPVAQKSINKNVDPAELPLAARKALFEKALLCGSPKINDVDVVNRNLSVAQRAAMFEKASKAEAAAKSIQTFKEPKRIAVSNFSKFEKKDDDIPKSPVKTLKTVPKKDPQEIPASPVKMMISQPVAVTPSPVKKMISQPVAVTPSPVKRIISQPVAVTPSPPKNVGTHTRLMQQKLMGSTGSNWQDKQAAKAAEERKQEISGLVNHWEKLSSSSSVETNSEMDRAHLASQERVSYESEDSEEFSESEKEPEHYVDNEVSTNNSYSMSGIDRDNDYEEDDEQIDEYSDEKTENEENVFYIPQARTEILKPIEKIDSLENHSEVTSVSSHGTGSIMSSLSYSSISSNADDSYNASNIQSYSSGSSAGSALVNSAVENPLQEKRESKNPEINLLRTVSAYRREKQETKLTPVRTIVRREKVSSPESPSDTDYTEVIQQRLKELQADILAQQTVISQSSQALNLCCATAEFSGSTEQVEAERLLLIATQKRQACLNEMTRLKTCAARGDIVADGTGSLTISDLQLPLKREFIASQLEGRGNDTVHYFLCLIRHGVQVMVTQMMSTDEKSSDGVLNFTNHIQLGSLDSNFSVVFEVYGLQTKKEVLNHEQKYHIKRENSKKRLTPLKGKKSDGKLLTPAICSPGGPNAVRSPSFGVVGFTRFTLQNCIKKTFTLDKVPFTSPLEGILRVNLQLHAEYNVQLRGFLTFYEDVGDRGALYRRWCVLDGDRIAYWMYPEDEHKKKPMGSIDLRQCTNNVVKSVPSLECARPHTFKLVTMRPQKKGDKNTLISRTVNTLTTIKYLLTADTKDERILWCNKINDALTNVRMWDPQAMRPIENMQI